MLKIVPGSSAREASALDHGAIRSTFNFFFKIFMALKNSEQMKDPSSSRPLGKILTLEA